jgi:predicted MPP superfamily phosphohydrolase
MIQVIGNMKLKITKNFHLTLSGHTHGMQFGIEIPGYFKWSLYVYAQWAGLYENLGNTSMWGFGFHAIQVEWG